MVEAEELNLPMEDWKMLVKLSIERCLLILDSMEKPYKSKSERLFGKEFR